MMGIRLNGKSFLMILYTKPRIKTLLILAFLALIIKRDLPLSKLPVIGKKFKKMK